MASDVPMVEVIDHLSKMIMKQFYPFVSQIYFGDVGVYPPKAFQLPSGQQGAVIALIPAYDKEHDDNNDTAAGVFRNIGIDIVVMINLTPFFEAMPENAPAERNLVRLVTHLREFLEKQSNIDLAQKVTMVNVGDITWAWQQRKNDAIRAAAIEFEATVYIDRT